MEFKEVSKEGEVSTEEDNSDEIFEETDHDEVFEDLISSRPD